MYNSRLKLILGAALLATLIPGSHANALSQLKHRDVTLAHCKAAGFTEKFCVAAAVAAANVDKHEWSNLAAHAQRAKGQGKCEAAEAAALRVAALGRKINAFASPKDNAENIGKAMHTLQDECAHRGMTNAQHAYLTIDARQSPDTNPAAVACADSITKRAFATLKETLKAKFHAGQLASWCASGCPSVRFVGPHELIEFWREKYEPNASADTRWRNGVNLKLLQAFNNGLKGLGAIGDVCGSARFAQDADALDNSDDVAFDEENLHDHEAVSDDEAESVVMVDAQSDSAGCSSSRTPSSLLMVVAFAALGLRRQRRGLVWP